MKAPRDDVLLYYTTTTDRRLGLYVPPSTIRAMAAELLSLREYKRNVKPPRRPKPRTWVAKDPTA